MKNEENRQSLIISFFALYTSTKTTSLPNKNKLVMFSGQWRGKLVVLLYAIMVVDMFYSFPSLNDQHFTPIFIRYAALPGKRHLYVSF